MKANPPWLLLDVNYLAYRAFFSTGGLSQKVAIDGIEKTMATGVTFGLFRDIVDLQALFGTTDIAFCFDHGIPLRKRLCPGYKEGRRKPKTPEEEASFKALQDQIYLLKTDYLQRLGYKNVFYQEGIEADDLIAAIVQGDRREFVIVSADKDLYQLLSPTVKQWNPHRKTMMTYTEFRREFNLLHPKDWAKVKALAGCSSDNIPGIKGIGEVTASRWFAGMVDPLSSTGKKIRDGMYFLETNMPLVQLPHPETKLPILWEGQTINPTIWRELCDQLGMTTLVEKPFKGKPPEEFKREMLQEPFKKPEPERKGFGFKSGKK